MRPALAKAKRPSTLGLVAKAHSVPEVTATKAPGAKGSQSAPPAKPAPNPLGAYAPYRKSINAMFDKDLAQAPEPNASELKTTKAAFNDYVAWVLAFAKNHATELNADQIARLDYDCKYQMMISSRFILQVKQTENALAIYGEWPAPPDLDAPSPAPGSPRPSISDEPPAIDAPVDPAPLDPSLPSLSQLDSQGMDPAIRAQYNQMRSFLAKVLAQYDTALSRLPQTPAGKLQADDLQKLRSWLSGFANGRLSLFARHAGGRTADTFTSEERARLSLDVRYQCHMAQWYLAMVLDPKATPSKADWPVPRPTAGMDRPKPQSLEDLEILALRQKRKQETQH